MSGPEAGSGLVAVVTAIPEEFETVSAFIQDGERLRGGGAGRGFLLRGKIGGANVLLGMTGDGPARAAASVSFLLGEFPVSLLVGAGAAGALDPSLRAGEILVASRVVEEAGEAAAPDASLVSRAVGLGARAATFVTVSRPVCSSREKGDLASRFRVPGSAPAVVDMESAAWGRAAAGRGVPFLLLRAVSDTLGEDRPGFLTLSLSADGSVDRAAAARQLH
ncbi:MAG TPA: hypothetical protein PK598_10140, partial [Thermoanaerobaculia bacterium]|nr:hypothetical protein [Thermoanaerobaculia bacterium]